MRCPECEKPIDFDQNFDNALYCRHCQAMIIIKKVTWDNGIKAKTFEYAEPDAEPELIEE